MRNAQDADTPHAMINAGLKLGLACPVCPHWAIFPLEKIAADPRPVWKLPFRQCGALLRDEQDVENFEAGKHRRG